MSVKITVTQELKGHISEGPIKEYPELETGLVITPSDREQKLKSDKYGYDDITVEPIQKSTEYKESLQIANDILGEEE